MHYRNYSEDNTTIHGKNFYQEPLINMPHTAYPDNVSIETEEIKDPVTVHMRSTESIDHEDAALGEAVGSLWVCICSIAWGLLEGTSTTIATHLQIWGPTAFNKELKNLRIQYKMNG